MAEKRVEAGRKPASFLDRPCMKPDDPDSPYVPSVDPVQLLVVLLRVNYCGFVENNQYLAMMSYTVQIHINLIDDSRRVQAWRGVTVRCLDQQSYSILT